MVLISLFVSQSRSWWVSNGLLGLGCDETKTVVSRLDWACSEAVENSYNCKQPEKCETKQYSTYDHQVFQCLHVYRILMSSMSNWAGAVMQFFTFFATQLRIIVLATKTMQSSNKQAEYPKIFSGKFKLSNRVWKSSKTSSIWVFISFLWKRASKKSRNAEYNSASALCEQWMFLTSKFL